MNNNNSLSGLSKKQKNKIETLFHNTTTDKFNKNYKNKSNPKTKLTKTKSVIKNNSELDLSIDIDRIDNNSKGCGTVGMSTLSFDF